MWALALLSFLFHLNNGCTTIVVGREATLDGSVMASHSNDGAGDAVANLRHIDSANWTPGSTRPVQGGSIPQVPHTFSYYSGGYPSINEFQVGLAERYIISEKFFFRFFPIFFSVFFLFFFFSVCGFLSY